LVGAETALRAPNKDVAQSGRNDAQTGIGMQGGHSSGIPPIIAANALRRPLASASAWPGSEAISRPGIGDYPYLELGSPPEPSGDQKGRQNLSLSQTQSD